MNRIFVTGDTHGKYDVEKLSFKQWKTSKELDKKDYLIIAGDFGFIWENEPSGQEIYWLNWFDEKPYTTLVVPGNHENYDRIFDLPITEMFGGKVRKYNDSVIFLERGEIYTIADKAFWIFGGGLSIDKDRRVLGQSYWEQELPTRAECDYGMDKLDEVNGKVDYIVTHAGPKQWVYKVLERPVRLSEYYEFTGPAKYKDPTSEYLQAVLDGYIKEYKQWFFGHYHEDKILSDDKAQALYHNIVEIKEE